MSDANTPTRQQTIDYVARLLKMNPIHQGGDIIRARNELLRLETKENNLLDASLSRQHARDYRARTLEKLNAVRNAFWTLPLAELNAQLDAVESHAFDDVKRAAARLRIVARNRDAFLSLVDVANSDTPFSDAQIAKSLKEVLIRSPRETVALREHIRDNFDVRAARKLATRMLRKLKSQLPELYELEAEWFDALQQRRSGKGLLLTSRSTVVRTQLRPSASKMRYMWLAIIVVSAVGRLASTIPEPNGHSTTFPPNSQYRPSIQTEAPPRQQQPAEATPRETPAKENNDVWEPFQSPYSDRALEHSGLNNDQKQMLRIEPAPFQQFDSNGR